MENAITDVAGVAVGHSTDAVNGTGCTVVLTPEGAVAGVDVRGLAPGTRETDVCRAGTLVRSVHAVLLAGGSAFGLAAAEGVMKFLWERGVGFDAGAIRIPIVPAAVIFDLGFGKAVWPDLEMGYQACLHSGSAGVEQGNVGAGTGATVGKLLGTRRAMKSGVGTASVRILDFVVGALVIVNAFGNVIDPNSGEIVAGARGPRNSLAGSMDAVGDITPVGDGQNTTIGVVAVDAELEPETVNHLATLAHDGLARTISPVHTLFDGDTMFAIATGRKGTVDQRTLIALGIGVVEATSRAVLQAVRHADPSGGLPSAGSVDHTEK